MSSVLRSCIFADKPSSSIPTVGFNMKRVQKGHVTLKWSVVLMRAACIA